MGREGSDERIRIDGGMAMSNERKISLGAKERYPMPTKEQREMASAIRELHRRKRAEDRRKIARYDRAVELLREIDVATNKVQDWDGTRVGSALGEIEIFLDEEPTP